MTCSDLSIAKIAWNHRRGACFFLVSLKSLRINHHYSMSFLEERLYSPLYLRVCFNMSRRHNTRFFLIMLEWETALRPPVKRKNCSWAASTWCSASSPWEVIASDSPFFTLSSSFRPSSKSPLISSFISFRSTPLEHVLTPVHLHRKPMILLELLPGSWETSSVVFVIPRTTPVHKSPWQGLQELFPERSHSQRRIISNRLLLELLP